MQYKDEKVIPFEGNYWWGSAEKVTSVLERELKKILSHTRISSIKISGSDFNDGREGRTTTIEVRESPNEIRVIKDYH